MDMGDHKGKRKKDESSYLGDRRKRARETATYGGKERDPFAGGSRLMGVRGGCGGENSRSVGLESPAPGPSHLRFDSSGDQAREQLVPGEARIQIAHRADLCGLQLLTAGQIASAGFRANQGMSMAPSTAILQSSVHQQRAVPGPPCPLVPTENDVPVIVVVPGWSVTDEFEEAIKVVLFGPRTSGRAPRNATKGMNSSVSDDVPGSTATGMVPPSALRIAIVHIFGSYNSYLDRHSEGLAAKAHLGRPDTTFHHNMWNRGLVKQSVSDLLDPVRPSVPECTSCSEPADWIASCCSLFLCSYCLPQGFLKRHSKAYCQEPCNGQGAIGLLHSPLQFTDEMRYLLEADMVCSRQMLFQIEDEESERSRLQDIFVLRSMLSLGDVWDRNPLPRRSTYFYQMRWDGHLRQLFRIKRELSILK